MRERVERRAARLLARQLERQLRLVDDPRQCARRRRRRASAARVAHAEVRASTPRPSTSSGSRRAASPVAAEIAFAVSIALPPPSASTPSPSLPRARRSSGRTAPRPSGACGMSIGASQRWLATSSGRSIPSSSQHRRRARSSPQRTITRQPLARELDERFARRASAMRPRRAHERDRRATGSRPRRAPSASVPGGELGLDRGARDERDAVAGERPRSAPTPAGRARAARRGRAAARPRAQLVLDHLADAGALLHHDQRLARAARRA